MMWLVIMGLCTLGAFALDGENNSSIIKDSPKTQKGFSSDFVRSNLRKFDYSDWDVDDVMERLSDNWFRQTVEQNMRRGERFQEAYESAVKEYDR